MHILLRHREPPGLPPNIHLHRIANSGGHVAFQALPAEYLCDAQKHPPFRRSGFQFIYFYRKYLHGCVLSTICCGKNLSKAVNCP
jgi:hypothetical protein